ncbi:transposase, partial [Lacticaseibacillus jixianensis]|uniref:transposase n=1 Tax=Lacticaseibacillus jixianensis TaxID=2486012 RepID=UPI0013DDA395
AEQLDAKIARLDQIIETEKVTVGGSQNKQLRRKLKKYTHLLHNDLIARKARYQDSRALFGDRNSFSKTDHDATFMMMKEDPMNNGQTKPGYNLQIATQNQFVLYYDVNQRPMDQRTLIPFLKQLDRHFRFVVADAGYGSEPNYDYITSQYHAVPLIPYTMYLKELSRRYRKDPTKRQNWQYDKTLDCYIDADGVQFRRNKEYDRTNKQTGTIRHFISYEAVADEDPELAKLALTEKGNLRQIAVNPHWEAQKESIRAHLTDEDQAILYATRKIEVEPVFGNMKHNLTFTRSSVRGLEPVRQELGLTLMAGNLQKLAILIEVHPDLLKGLLTWGSICRTLKVKIATKVEKSSLETKKRPNYPEIFW